MDPLEWLLQPSGQEARRGFPTSCHLWPMTTGDSELNGTPKSLGRPGSDHLSLSTFLRTLVHRHKCPETHRLPFGCKRPSPSSLGEVPIVPRDGSLPGIGGEWGGRKGVRTQSRTSSTTVCRLKGRHGGRPLIGLMTRVSQSNQESDDVGCSFLNERNPLFQKVLLCESYNYGRETPGSQVKRNRLRVVPVPPPTPTTSTNVSTGDPSVPTINYELRPLSSVSTKGKGLEIRQLGESDTG